MRVIQKVYNNNNNNMMLYAESNHRNFDRSRRSRNIE